MRHRIPGFREPTGYLETAFLCVKSFPASSEGAVLAIVVFLRREKRKGIIKGRWIRGN